MSENYQKRHAEKDDAIDMGDRTSRKDCPVIVAGIGASGGAVKSLKQLFDKMEPGHGVAFVLIQHLDPSQENLIVKFLKDQTALAVVEATEGMPVLADRIHVIPPNKFLNIIECKLTLQEPVYCNGLRMPVDHFFCSLAADQKRRGCGIILSSTGSDGTLGLSEIKAAGGKTLVEDPGSAEFPSMPQSAIDAGVADVVLPADAMAEAIISLAEQVITETRSAPLESPEFDANLRAVLDILRTKVGYDFRCYKPNTLVRRIRRRMTLGNMMTFADYVQFLHEHPDEVGLLQKDLLIGVTEFFRQPQAWEVLNERVISILIGSAQPGLEIRVWVPGCSTGKEAYSIAMLLAEQAEKFGKKVDIQIFATDSDVAALAAARSGTYSEEEIRENVSAERVKRFFERREGHYQVIKKIREQIVFAPQNLIADPPFSRLDLISCRNLLIYLDPQVQRKIIALFHFALREGGCLFLGNAETIGDQEDLFEPVSKKWRIYRRIGIGRPVGVGIPLRTTGGPPQEAGKMPVAASAWRISLASAAQQILLERFAPACVIIDRKLQVLYVHGPVEDYLTFPSGELTTKVVDMAREGLRARLRGAISKCIEANRPVSVTARVRRGEKSVPVKATVTLLRYLREADGLLLITFEDYRVSAVKLRRQAAGENYFQKLEEELKVTREELQSTIEQLEISNDQLKASNAEVTAANEELQSANEEMETSKEELQSLNEELNTINTRLQEKVAELENTNNDVVNLLSSTAIATVFLDKELKVKRYSPAITRLMSLISSDIGRPIADVLRRFSDEALLEDAARVLADLMPVSKEVQAEDGRWYIRRITPYRTQDDRIEGVVITFTEVSDLKQTEQALRKAHERAVWLARFPEENPNPVIRVSADGSVLYCNPAAAEMPGWRCEVGQPLPDLILPIVVQAMAKEQEVQQDLQLGGRFYSVWIAPFPVEGYANVYGRDITERKATEEALRRSEEDLAHAQAVAHTGSWRLDVRRNELMWSDETHRMFGVPRGTSMTYETFLRAVHPDDREYVNRKWKAALRGEPYHVEHRIIVGNMVKWVREQAELELDSQGQLLGGFGTVQDITERKRYEQALRDNEARFKLLSETAGRLLSTDDPQGIINDLCRDVMAHLECQAFFNFLVDEEAGRLHLNACAGIPEEEARKVEWLDYGVAVCGCVARDGVPIVAEDIWNTPDPRTDLVKSYGIQAYACHPLIVQGRLIGTLSFGTKTRPNFTLEELALMRTVTDQVATAMDRVRLIKEIQRSRDELETRVQERTAELAKANEVLRHLSSKLLSAQEDERKRIAGELHDTIGACLNGIRFKVENVLQEIENNPNAAAESLNTVIPIVQESIDECRRIQMDLRPSLIDDLGILASLSWFCRRFQTIYSATRIEQEIDIKEEEVPKVLKIVIYRVMQEAMSNIAKHSKADFIRLSFRKVDGRMDIMIQDNGRGFNLEEALTLESTRRGLGLSSMRERVELSGGSFGIESTGGRGTIIRASWPLEGSEK